MPDELAARPQWRWYAAWLLVGFLFVLGVLSMLSIGVFVLPFAIVGAAALLRREERRAGWPGVISGLGLPLLYVAYGNRSGPGLVCTTTPTSQSCTEQWSPWPWLGFGVMLLAMGVIEMVRRQRSTT